jgi:hypothetical protein
VDKSLNGVSGPIGVGLCVSPNFAFTQFSEVAPALVSVHTIHIASKEGRTMREQIQARLEELKKERETGQAELQKVEMQRTYLRETVLRIDGAVQVLEELLAGEPHAKADEAVGPGEDQLATAPNKEAAG